MTRRLTVVDATEVAGVTRGLRDALTADGPAILPRTGPGESLAEPQVPQSVALVIETSGSTGVPKRVMLSRDALLAAAAASESALGGAGQWLLALPLHYIAGCQILVRSIAAGTEPVVLPAGHFDPAAFCAAAGTMTGDALFTSLVPAQLVRLLDAADADPALLPSLRRFDRILIGGQRMPDGLRDRATSAGVRFTRTYGASETCGGCVYDGIPIGSAQARSVGGTIELAGPMLAEGYLGDPERTERAFHTEDGIRWYRTGDVGDVVDGAVRVAGRADNVIISGGEKVLLDAVERVVQQCRGFGDAVVVAVPSERWGEVPVVALESTEPALSEPTSLGDLRRHVEAALGRAAAPAGILALPALPRLTSGKPDRRAIAAAARSEGLGRR